MNPRVTAVILTDNHQLRLTFTNGEVGVYDCTPLLNFGVFKELKDIDYFKRARVENGTVVWPHEQDICPDTLYEDSTKDASPTADQTNAFEPAVGPVANGESPTPAG